MNRVWYKYVSFYCRIVDSWCGLGDEIGTIGGPQPDCKNCSQYKAWKQSGKSVEQYCKILNKDEDS